MRLPRVSSILAIAAAAVCWSAPSLAGCVVKRFAMLPITVESGVPVTQGEINGRPVRLVVQSNAFYNAISLQSARDLALSVKPISSSFEISWGGKVGPAGRANVDTLKLNGWIVRGVNFIVGGSSTGGIIGQNILSLRDVEYDFAHGTVRLSVAENCIGASPVYWAPPGSVMSLRIEEMDEVNRIPVGTIVINGQKLPVTFASAGGSSITPAAVKKLNLPSVQAGAEDGAGGRVRFDTVEIGDEKLRGGTLQVQDGTGNDDASVTIGTDFFQAHRIYVANLAHRIYFTYAGGPVLGVVPEGLAVAGQPTGTAH
jgi:hypothetical protein